MAKKSRRRKRKTRLIARAQSRSTARSSAADVDDVLEALLKLAAFRIQLDAARESKSAMLLFSTAKNVAASASLDVLVANQRLLEDTEAKIDGQLEAVALFDKKLGRL